MKFMKFAVLGLLLASQAQAFEAYEDSDEFLSQEMETNFTDNAHESVTPNEIWTYQFELVKKDNTTKVISKQNENTLVKPASTMKLFTGYMAYKKGVRTDAYLYQMLRQSVNNMAEATVQKMGGVYAMEDWFKAKGLNLNESNFTAADGSGLSYDNKATCAIEIKLLKMIKADATYSRFKKLLAQPGKDGTIQKRLTGLKGLVFAKTGTLAKTASLTGFVETPKGTMLFCVMSDYLKGSVNNARNKIDAMVIKNYNLARK